MQFWFILSLVFAVLIALFAVLNSDEVTLNLVITTLSTRQSVIILASAAIGAIIASFIGMFRTLKSSLKIRDLNHQIKELQQNLEKLKTENEALTEKTNTETEAPAMKDTNEEKNSENEI
ncbi:MAG: DUF1049 domain-containing protein [Clostridiales bacterium]|nr:DUF1049 domain-containing protein [Clostridiales bacterium]